MKRCCPICESREATLVFRQEFSQMSGGVIVRGYDVVVCRGCGFGFADGIPSQEQFDAYYRDASKYENQDRAGESSSCAIEGYRVIADRISGLLPGRSNRIIDMGCATGGLLSLLKERGYTNIMGVDPSPACAEAALRVHGVRVLNCAISGFRAKEGPVDAMLLCSVLEHIQDLRGALLELRESIADTGLLYVEVPDVTRFAAFASAPFQQFSVEHINYCSLSSLCNLAQSVGFSLVEAWSDERRMGASVDPALCAAFRKSNAPSRQAQRDTETLPALTFYVDASKRVESVILATIARVVETRFPIVVWGTGTHTLRLLATSNLGDADIRAYVDSNPRYWGKSLKGIPIISPEDLRHHNEPILVSSQVYQSEIAAHIRDDLKLGNELILLYRS